MPLRCTDNQISSFSWLRDKKNRLFVIEEGKKLRTICTTVEIGKEFNCATLTEEKTCTSLAWNNDSTLVALVVDKRKIYIWDLESGNFLHYRQNLSGSSNNSIGKKVKSKDVVLLAWSKISNRLVISLSNGQLILSKFDNKNFSNPTEKLIDNNVGVARAVTSIECSDQLDLFVCITIGSEVLIMTFDGEAIFYIHSQNLDILRVKLSPFDRNKNDPEEELESAMKNQSMWVTYQTKDGKLLFRKISISDDNIRSSSTRADLVYDEKDDMSLVDFYWLSEKHVVLCYSSGVIMLLEPKTVTTKGSVNLELKSEEIFDLTKDESIVAKGSLFKKFDLMLDNNDNGYEEEENCFSLIAITDYQLFYYRLFDSNRFTKTRSFEKVDDLDLTGSLNKINLQIAEVKWSYDCSMLALQLTNQHILVYITRLQNYMVVSNQSKTAYLSGVNEITVLDYRPELRNTKRDDLNKGENDIKLDEKESSLYNGGSNALTVHLDLKPSLIAIGPKHLAIALNNRVRFYHITSVDPTTTTWLSHDQDYLSNVVQISLCSRFVAVMFDDGRLKLHALNNLSMDPDEDNYKSEKIYDERFFPDPVRLEIITSFVLTEELFIYSTGDSQMNVFSLTSWTIIQTLDYAQRLNISPIIKLKPNEKGNKFVCLLRESAAATKNVYLYDLYSNMIIELFNQNLYSEIYFRQWITYLNTSILSSSDIVYKTSSINLPRLNRIKDAIWDLDGRTLLLVERKSIHNCVVLDHTLEREETTVEYVSTTPKASSYTTLYASHGIVSFQTNLGRVINLISESFDDDLRLTKLRQQIQEVIQRFETNNDAMSDREGKNCLNSPSKISRQDLAQAEVIRLKLEYLRVAFSLYSLSKSKDICEFLLNDQQFNLTNRQNLRADSIIWRQLASWGLYTMNFGFAQMIYRKHGLLVEARVLSEIIEDARVFGIDLRVSMKTRLLILLGCEGADNEVEDFSG